MSTNVFVECLIFMYFNTYLYIGLLSRICNTINSKTNFELDRRVLEYYYF
jgi:hypothetical protein